jgi:ABC-type hemin transport system substrate-binding protein
VSLIFNFHRSSFESAIAVALTPDGCSRRVVVMEDVLLLCFGPRLSQTAEKVALARREVRAP